MHFSKKKKKQCILFGFAPYMHKNKITTVELLTGSRFDAYVQAHKNVRVILYLTYFVELVQTMVLWSTWSNGSYVGEYHFYSKVKARQQLSIW